MYFIRATTVAMLQSMQLLVIKRNDYDFDTFPCSKDKVLSLSCGNIVSFWETYCIGDFSDNSTKSLCCNYSEQNQNLQADNFLIHPTLPFLQDGELKRVVSWKNFFITTERTGIIIQFAITNPILIIAVASRTRPQNYAY